jgi:ATP-dependent helicase/nuclease subunit A
MTEAIILGSDIDHAPDYAPEVRQRAASDPATSAWVNASAGSGKTTVLTSRVTRLLLSGVEPQRILCLTFTRAAAAEMSLRVTAMLSEWATCDDNQLSKSLSELQGTAPSAKQMTSARRLFAQVLACPGGMRIRTIHAFCQEILRRFPIEAGLAPHFAVIEDSDARAMQDEAQQDLLRDAANDPGGAIGLALNKLSRELGEREFSGAMQSLINDKSRLRAAIAQAGSLGGLVAALRARLDLAPDDSSDSIRTAALDDRMPRDRLRQAARALLQGGKTAKDFGESLLVFLELSPDEQLAGFDDYAGLFFKENGELYAKYGDKKALAVLPELEDILVAEAARLISVRERLEAANTAEQTEAILVFGQQLITRYEKRKHAQAALDYDDLIARTDELLRRPGIAPWVLYKLDGGIDHILVDEAQDTSRAQWSIVAALADEFFAGAGSRADKNRTLFVVGDEKQSIFSFQRADPEAFAERRQYFAEKITAAEKAFQPVPLRVSFRSAPAILQAVDAVFAVPETRAGVSFVPVQHFAAKPRAGENEKIGRVEIWPLLPPAPKEKDQDDGIWPLPLGYEKEHDPQAELAARIAGVIKGWLTRKENLPGYNRPIAASDIMILLRRRGRMADLLVRALKEKDVAVTGVDRMRLVKQLPVMDLLAVMQFALLPEDDLNLATILRGPLIGFSEDQLMQAAIGRKGTLWNALNDLAAQNAGFKPAYEYLARWLNAADLLTPFAMLSHILNETCPAKGASGRNAIWSRLGPDALDPVNELLNAAQNFGHRHSPSLQSFLHWLMASEADIKRELDRSGGQVRIMTVHASKGLEAPIVFLPDTANVPRSTDMPKFLWDGDDVPFYVPRKPGVNAVRRLWDAARDRQMEEYRRLLYVALTRAANRLYIAGWQPARKEPNSEHSWHHLITEPLKALHQPAYMPENQDDLRPLPDIVLADPELRPAPQSIAAAPKPAPVINLPEWARHNPVEEPRALRSISPSRRAFQQIGQQMGSQNILPPAPPAASPDRAFSRGRIIHRLLQSLPDIDDARREAVAKRFLANPQHRLTEAQQSEIAKEVLQLLRHADFAPLFGVGSRAEVPLVGRVGHDLIAGQVDRLCVREDAVWIVDYKTNRPPPQRPEDVAEAYLLQLASYRAVLREIYPGKPIRCFLLWTYGPRLMEIPAELLPEG